MVVRELITKILFKTDERGLKNAEMKTKRFAKAAKWAVAGIAVGIAAIGVASVKAASDMEMLQTQFEVMLGSAERASSLMDELKKFSAATPFQLKDLARGTQTLLSFGVAEEDVLDRMRMLGDTAGGNAEKLRALILAYGKVQTKGKVSMEEINMIAERGVPIIGTLVKQLGVTEQQFFKMISAGKIGRKDITQAFKTMTSEGGMFFKGMEKQSLTFAGIISTLKDNLTLVAAEIGNALLPLLKTLATTLIGLVQGPLGDLIETLVGILVPILEILTPMINMVLGAIAPLNKILEILARLIGKLLAGAMKIIAPLMELIAEVVGVIATVFEELEPILGVIIDLWVEFMSMMTREMVEVIKDILPLLTEILIEVVQLMAELLDAFLPLIKMFLRMKIAISKIGLKAFSIILKLILGQVRKIIGPIRDLVRWLGDKLAPAFEKVGEFFDRVFGGIIEGINKLATWVNKIPGIKIKLPAPPVPTAGTTPGSSVQADVNVQVDVAGAGGVAGAPGAGAGTGLSAGDVKRIGKAVFGIELKKVLVSSMG